MALASYGTEADLASLVFGLSPDGPDLRQRIGVRFFTLSREAGLLSCARGGERRIPGEREGERERVRRTMSIHSQSFMNGGGWRRARAFSFPFFAFRAVCMPRQIDGDVEGGGKRGRESGSGWEGVPE